MKSSPRLFIDRIADSAPSADVYINVDQICTFTIDRDKQTGTVTLADGSTHEVERHQLDKLKGKVEVIYRTAYS